MTFARAGRTATRARSSISSIATVLWTRLCSRINCLRSERSLQINHAVTAPALQTLRPTIPYELCSGQPPIRSIPFLSVGKHN
jgi:hypothetical protein